MMCDRCDQPIPPGQEERVPVDGASGAGTTLVLHRILCRRPPSHAAPYPSGLGRLSPVRPGPRRVRGGRAHPKGAPMRRLTVPAVLRFFCACGGWL